jgi:hypothetical protein
MKKIILIFLLLIGSFAEAQKPAKHSNGVQIGDPSGTSIDPVSLETPGVVAIYWNTTLAEFRKWDGSVWSTLVRTQDNVYRNIKISADNFSNLAISIEINALSNFTITDTDIVFFTVKAKDRNVEGILTVVLKDLGAGNYGVGGTQITQSQVSIIARDIVNITQVEEDPETQVVNLGDIGASTIEDGFNAYLFTGIEDPIQEQDEGYVLVNATQNAELKQYLFVGIGGTYGTSGALTSVNEDFSLLTNEVSTNTDDQTALEVVSDDSSYDIITGTNAQLNFNSIDNELFDLQPINLDTNSSVLDIDKTIGRNYDLNSGSPNNNTAFTLGGTIAINGYARVLINVNAPPTFPAGVTQQSGIDFIANTDLYLIVWSKGTTVNDVFYYFASLGISSGSGGGLGNIVEDLTPQLGGDFDLQGYFINSDGNIRLDIDHDANTSNSSFWITRENGTNFVKFEEAGYSSFGVQDSDWHYIRVYGNNTSVGGGVTIYNSADEDTTAQYFTLTSNDDFEIRSNTGVGLTVDSATLGLTAPSMSDADIVTLGNDALLTKRYGDANYLGGSGGTLQSVLDADGYAQSVDSNSYFDWDINNGSSYLDFYINNGVNAGGIYLDSGAVSMATSNTTASSGTSFQSTAANVQMSRYVDNTKGINLNIATPVNVGQVNVSIPALPIGNYTVAMTSDITSQNLQQVTDGVGAGTTTNAVIIQNELTVGDGSESNLYFDDGQNGAISADGGALSVQHDVAISLSAPSVEIQGKQPSLIAGTYDITTNTPALSNTDTNKRGTRYRSTVAGTRDFGAGVITLGVDDVLENYNSIWYKSVDNNQVLSTIPSEDINSYATFNGSTSIIDLTTPITLVNDGDYLEIEFYATEFNSVTKTSVGLIGEPNTSSSVLGLWHTGLMYVRNSSGTWLSTDATTTGSQSNTRYVVRLDWNAADISVSLDGVFQKTITTGEFVIENIGDAYNHFKGGVGYIKVYDGTTLTEVDNVLSLPSVTSTDVGLQLKSALGGLSPNVSYEDSYYEFDFSEKQFIVYSSMGFNRYAGFKVELELDLSDTPYTNQWRIVEADRYTYDGVSMLGDGVQLLYTGENEFVYKRDGKTDFTGGWHGDETLNNVRFFANGQSVPITSDIDLTSGNSFYFVQNSNLHEADDLAHPVEAIKDKLVKFKNGGYEVRARVTLQEDITFTYLYTGISCISKEVADFGHNELNDFEQFTDVGTNSIAESFAREYYAANVVNKTSVFVTSALLNPVSEDYANIMNVADRTNDNKYYRKYVPTSLITSGTIIESEMKVVFKYKN